MVNSYEDFNSTWRAPRRRIATWAAHEEELLLGGPHEEELLPGEPHEEEMLPEPRGPGSEDRFLIFQFLHFFNSFNYLERPAGLLKSRNEEELLYQPARASQPSRGTEPHIAGTVSNIAQACHFDSESVQIHRAIQP